MLRQGCLSGDAAAPKRGKALPGRPLRSGAPRPPLPLAPFSPGSAARAALFAPRCCQLKNETAPASPKFPAAGTQQMSPGRARAGAGCCWNHPHSTEHRDRAEPPGLPAPGKTRTGRDRTKRGILKLFSHPRDPHGTRRTGLLHPHLPKPADPSGCTQGPAEQRSARLGNGSFQQGNKPNIPGRCSSISQHRAEPSYTERPGRKRVRRGDPLPREPVLRSLQSLQATPEPPRHCRGGHRLRVPLDTPNPSPPRRRTPRAYPTIPNLGVFPSTPGQTWPRFPQLGGPGSPRTGTPGPGSGPGAGSRDYLRGRRYL